MVTALPVPAFLSLNDALVAPMARLSPLIMPLKVAVAEPKVTLVPPS